MAKLRKGKAELFTLLDKDRLKEAVELLKTFSQEELAELLLEALMLDRIVKAKIKFLREEVSLRFKDH